MTNLSTELKRLSAGATPGDVYLNDGDDYWTADIDLPQVSDLGIPGKHYAAIQVYGKTEAIARNRRDEVIAALEAAETPLPDDVAGLVEQLWANAEDYTGELQCLAADLIEAQTRQLAQRDAEIKALRGALTDIAEVETDWTISTNANMEVNRNIARSALEG